MNNMILKKIQSRKFRSVLNSGWIDCDSVTTLVGINEAGKSNLLWHFGVKSCKRREY